RAVAIRRAWRRCVAGRPRILPSPARARPSQERRMGAMGFAGKAWSRPWGAPTGSPCLRAYPRRIALENAMATQRYRMEHDSMGELKVPADALWGAQTQRAVQNFPVSGRPMP